jgi:membrane protease YdiL (CAAX protease family)
VTPAGLWSRIGLGALLATGLPLALDIPAPTDLHVPAPLALTLGLVGGLALYSISAHRRPLPIRAISPIKTTFVVGWAWIEEILWRWLLLGGLALRLPLGVAFAAATAAFALAHSHGRRSQLVAGATFGGLYLLTGGLWAPIAAHVTHNLLVASSLSPARAEVRLG